MQQKLLIDGFRLEKNKSKYTQKFNENYDDGSNNGYMLEVDASYAKRLHKIHSDLPLLHERMNIEKSQKLVCNLFNKKNYVVNKKALT